MPFGPTGLLSKTLAEHREEIRAALKAAFGAGIKTSPDAVFGLLADVVANAAANASGIIQAVYDSLDPDQARGVQLDNVVALAPGIVREAASPSTVALDATGTPLAVIPAGSLFAVEGPDGPRFTNPNTEVVGAGGAVTFPVESVETGPIEAPAGTLTVIITGLPLTAVTNALDAVLGRNVETDVELRARREDSLQAGGDATDGAIRAALLALVEVVTCTVISNRTPVVDSFGIPGHGFRCVIWPDPVVLPGDDDEIFKTIFIKMPAGIQPDGARTALVTDSQGLPQTVAYSIAVELKLFVTVTVVAGTAYPVDGDAQVAELMVEYGAELNPGDTFELLEALCRARTVPGVLTGTAVFAKIGGAPALGPPDDVDVTATVVEVLTVDLGDVLVTS